MSAHTDMMAVRLERAIEATSQRLFPLARERGPDNLTVATRFAGIVGALIVADALDALRREVADDE